MSYTRLRAMALIMGFTLLIENSVICAATPWWFKVFPIIGGAVFAFFTVAILMEKESK